MFNCLESLRKCKFPLADTIMLTYGDSLATSTTFPITVRVIAQDILDIENKLWEVYDPFEIKILELQLDLSVLMLKGALVEYLKNQKVNSDSWLIEKKQ
jgi:hypothetical protein